MAIIKCPECGHQISDKAPVCPNCGVEIAGKIIKCSHCGHVYFNDEASCPHCHTANADAGTDVQAQHLASGNVVTDSENATNVDDTALQQENTSLPQKPDNANVQGSEKKKSSKANKTILIVSLIVAVVIIGVCLFFYLNAKNNREQEEYAYALGSNDIEISQAYLDNYKDAPQAHIDSVTAHLQALLKQNQDWTNAVVSGSRTALAEFLNAYPESPYAKEAVDKIDSMDWEQCLKQNTPDAYQTYIDTQAALGVNQDMAAAMADNIATGYAVAYPLGVLGVIGSILLIKGVFHIKVKDEKERMDAASVNLDSARRLAVEIKNPAIFGKTLYEIDKYIGKKYVVSRLYKASTGKAEMPSSDSHIWR